MEIKNCQLLKRPFDRVINDIYFDTNSGGSSTIKKGTGSLMEYHNDVVKIDGFTCALSDKIKIKFEVGHFNELEDDAEFMNRKPIHLHSNFIFNDKEYHIDYYGLGHYGPGSTLHEILLFKKNSLLKRGGKGNVSFASFANNWPLILIEENAFLCFDDFPTLKNMNNFTAKKFVCQ